MSQDPESHDWRRNLGLPLIGADPEKNRTRDGGRTEGPERRTAEAGQPDAPAGPASAPSSHGEH